MPSAKVGRIIQRKEEDMALDYRSIGLRIKYYRKLKKMTQVDLAAMVDSTRKYISLMETGEKTFGLEMLVNVANALEVSMDALLVDNLTNANSETDTDLHYILLDCTRDQMRILTKNAVALKDILREYGI